MIERARGPSDPSRSNESLSYDELLDREADQRNEFMRREEDEPQLRETTYRALRGSLGLLKAWDQWLRTNVAVQLRGLVSREHRR